METIVAVIRDIVRIIPPASSRVMPMLELRCDGIGSRRILVPEPEGRELRVGDRIRAEGNWHGRRFCVEDRGHIHREPGPSPSVTPVRPRILEW